MTIKIKWKKLHPKAKLPQFGSDEAACFDIYSSFDGEKMNLEKSKVTAIPTGLAVEIPKGFELQLRARSGLAFKHGVTLVNGVGTIDSDYRGEVKVLLTLLGAESLEIKNGERICQGCLKEVVPVVHEWVNELKDSSRGAGGFGSTGVGELNS